MLGQLPATYIERIDTPAIVIDSAKIISATDNSANKQKDTIVDTRKEEVKEKLKGFSKVFSYIKYTDKASPQFEGVEKYKPYAGKKIRNIDIEILPPFGVIEDDFTITANKRQQEGIRYILAQRIGLLPMIYNSNLAKRCCP
jgi:hypothetical protein